MIHAKIIPMMAIAGIFAFNSCVTIPKGAVAVRPFYIEKYLGTWYEIARMDFRFERDMSNVTANYTLNKDGSIKVDNRGYNYVTKEWKQALGIAKMAGLAEEARLKVSFFGPFYSPYNVIAIDEKYTYALVVGKNLKYIWILSREKSIPDNIKQKYLKLALDLGFDTSILVWTEQTKE